LDAEVPEELELSIEPPEPRKHVGEAARSFADEKLHEFIVQNPGANTRALREVNKDHTSLTKSLDRLKAEQKIYTQPGARGSVLHYASQ
jgi:hypothetical protein